MHINKMEKSEKTKSRNKVEFLKNIEKTFQAVWDKSQLFEINADNEVENKMKFFATFPYPYMNGQLHLGHAFSFSKCEFAIRFQRLQGKKCMWPFGFHCTGMPIKACADKLKREIVDYGLPPTFPETNEESLFDIGIKENKSKVVAKVDNKWQWNVLKSMNIPEKDIPKFQNSSYWLQYFPPVSKKDLKSLGLHIDWRRSFITTDANPFYDSFVKWQFLKFKEKNKIKFGKRYTIFSPKDNQPCMDHDRSIGEGLGATEYTAIKLKLITPLPEKLKLFEDKQIFLVAATLRPETVYGQTNCWIHPDIEYILFETLKGEYFVTTFRAARNMAYQNFTKNFGCFDILLSLQGMDLLGALVKAPLSSYDCIYVLPMLTIKEKKGTGIVMSVPSDSPNDFAALRDLQNKPEFRRKYRITDEMIPIIDVPEYGSLAAVKVCDQLKIKSQNDQEKLLEAKQILYLKSFHGGIQNIKKKIQEHLQSIDSAFCYQETENLIMSRSGDECVVALCDQWYLDYGNTYWKEKVKEYLKNVNLFHDEIRRNFEASIDWLQDHACSRTYGLGSVLPWDEQWLIESLSDSTIYMAYYTIAHYLQGGTFDGKLRNELGIQPADMTNEVWDYIFLKDTAYPKNTRLSKDILDKLKNEFIYWYPVDLRVSGKDLIPNHLTYYLYNHIAIWENNTEIWPKAIHTNGLLMLNSEKMSKSTGNFLTIEQAVETFGADGTRFGLADAGDTIEDANFSVPNVEAGILRLYNYVHWVKHILNSLDKLRSTDEFNLHDKIFDSQINELQNQTEKNYELMQFKEALRTGFFEMQLARDKYREMCLEGIHKKLILKFIEMQTILISPICPHVSEYVWHLLGHAESIVLAKWPIKGPIDYKLLHISQYLETSIHNFRLKLKSFLASEKKRCFHTAAHPNHLTLCIAKKYPQWQEYILTTLKEYYENIQIMPENKMLSSLFSSKSELQKHKKHVMPFAQMIKEKFLKEGIQVLDLEYFLDEKFILESNAQYICASLEIIGITIRYSNEDEEGCWPGSPKLIFDRIPCVKIAAINPQYGSGLFEIETMILHNENVKEVSKRLALNCGRYKDAEKFTLYRYVDPILGPRQLPVINNWKTNLIQIPQNVCFVITQEKAIEMVENNTNISLGNQIMYICSNT